jgi:RNA polymerase-binding transcription factor DksA
LFNQESDIDSSLSSTQRAVLRNELQLRFHALEARQSIRREGLSEVDHEQLEMEQDADDAQQRAGDHEVEAALIDIEKQEFIELRDAMQRIEEDDYGACIGCGKTIAYARLQDEPQTERCEICEAASEKKS